MQTRLAQTVANQIRESIIASGMAEGQKLPSENVLMQHHSVSRSTIREAMKILQAENIVEIRHGLGSFVAANTGIGQDPLGLSFTDPALLLPDLMELRLLTEPGLAEIAARKRTEADLEKMESAVNGMIKARRQGLDYHTSDYQFHMFLANASGNCVINRLFPVIFDAIENGYAHTVHVQGSFDRAADYHVRILQAIRLGDGAEASRLARMHIQQTLTEIQEDLKGETNP